MVALKKKKDNGLGKAIINSRFKRSSVDYRDGNPERHRVGDDGQDLGGLKSVTQERDLDEFLSTAELAGTDFTAEKRNIKILNAQTQANRYLLSSDEKRESNLRQGEHRARLRVPRRPAWSEKTTHKELDQLERENFLEWRRGLAELQDDRLLLLTPFERNLQVWRQLWRVVERSHLIVQIVDARNPLLFRCPDLEDYVHELDPRKRTMVLVNKADLLSQRQRQAWASWFRNNGIRAAFFSAKASQIETADEEASEDAEIEDEEVKDERIVEETEGLVISQNDNGDADDNDDDAWESESEEDQEQDSAQIVNVSQLEDLLLQEAPPLSDFATDSFQSEKTLVGLVGYPNVGKSSTINALLGAKKVSVSSTPGKTKHFQTIHLSDRIVLCDCPGLVFPNFASTKADLVCDGVLPIDQLREHTGPVALIGQRIPRTVLEAIYGIKIHTKPIDEGGLGTPTSEEILVSYAIARGFTRSSQGNPDEARAARFILKDYVNGKLLYCHPPPDLPGGADAFNLENRLEAAQRIGADGILKKKTAPTNRVSIKSVVYDPTIHESMTAGQDLSLDGQGPKSRQLDTSFFRGPTSDRPKVAGRKKNAMGRDSARVQVYGHQSRLGNDGRPIESIGSASGYDKTMTGREARLLRAQAIMETRQAARENGAGPDEETASPSIKALPKKHFKPTRQKQRSGAGYL